MGDKYTDAQKKASIKYLKRNYGIAQKAHRSAPVGFTMY